MRYLFQFVILMSLTSCAQTSMDQDTIIRDLEAGYEYTLRIYKHPCEHDTTKWCVSIDTLSKKSLGTKTVFDWADSIALSVGVPPKLIYEIGMNESKWPNPGDLDYLIRDGDLQVIDQTFNYWYKKLNLQGGKTRYNYLVVGIHYFSL